MNAFERWNIKLLEHFFQAGRAGREVFLCATPDVLAEIGGELGGDEGFLEAVRAGPGVRWATKAPTLESRLSELVSRRLNSQRRLLGYAYPEKQNPVYSPDGVIEKSAPTYLPYLAALARGAAVADAHGYYARLRNDLGLAPAWGTNQMAQTTDAWKDLEKWTKATKGHFGNFTFRVLGKLQYVGLAKGQVMVAARDYPVLFDLFESLGLQPGTALSAEEIERIVSALLLEGSGVSRGVRQAAADPQYAEILADRLSVIHAEWRGPAPVGSSREPAGVRKPRQAGSNPDFRFGLGLGIGDALPWRVLVGVDEGSPLGTPDGVADATLSPASGSMQSPIRWVRDGVGGWWAELSPAASTAVLSGEHWQLRSERGAWDLEGFEDPQVFVLEGGAGYRLWAESWPEAGSAVVVSPNAAHPAFLKFLELFPEGEQYPQESLKGLPPGFAMVYVESCDRLNDEQRAAIHAVGRRTRLITLKGGTKEDGAYLPYDLPAIIYRGPPAWQVALAGQPGLQLEDITEAPSGVGALRNGMGLGAVARVLLLPRELEDGRSFRIVVLDDGGNEKAARSIPVRATEDPSLARNDTTVCLDRFGRIAEGSEGIQGVMPATLARRYFSGNGGDTAIAECARDELGSEPGLRGALEHPAVLFLDALSAAGSLSYSAARAKIDRLVSRRGGAASPATMLVDLWRRGFIEIAQGRDGGIHRIHAVPPCAYPTTWLSEGRQIMGLAGTIRRSQWEGLAKDPVGIRLVESSFARDANEDLPALRLSVAGNEILQQQFLAHHQLEWVPGQALALVRWSASLPEVRAQLLDDCQPPREGAVYGGLKRFDAVDLRYVDVPAGRPERLREGQRIAIYKFEDARRKNWWRHLAITKHGASTAADREWMRWVAMEEVGRGLRSAPIFYDTKKSRLYIPAAMRPPLLLERALVFCSGMPAIRSSFDAWPDGRQIQFGYKNSGQVFFDIDEDLCSGITGTEWLRYDGVPEPVFKAMVQKSK